MIITFTFLEVGDDIKKSCTNCVYIIIYTSQVLKFIYMTTSLILHVSKLYIRTYLYKTNYFSYSKKDNIPFKKRLPFVQYIVTKNLSNGC